MSLPLVTRFGADPLLDLELTNKQYVDNRGGNTFARVMKLVDTARASQDTVENDPELFIALNASKHYTGMIYCWLRGPAAADFKYRWSLPSGATFTDMANSAWSGVSDGATVDMTTEVLVTLPGVGLDVRLLCLGFRITTDTAGTLNFQWSQFASITTATIVLENSVLIVFEDPD